MTGFLGSGNKPQPISEKRGCALFRRRRPKPSPRPKRDISVDYEIGDSVKVLDGPFASFNGIVEELDFDKAKVKVGVSIFGRATPGRTRFRTGRTGEVSFSLAPSGRASSASPCCPIAALLEGGFPPLCSGRPVGLAASGKADPAPLPIWGADVEKPAPGICQKKRRFASREAANAAALQAETPLAHLQMRAVQAVPPHQRAPRACDARARSVMAMRPAARPSPAPCRQSRALCPLSGLGFRVGYD